MISRNRKGIRWQGGGDVNLGKSENMNRNRIIYKLTVLEIGAFCSQDIGTTVLGLVSCIV